MGAGLGFRAPVTHSPVLLGPPGNEAYTLGSSYADSEQVVSSQGPTLSSCQPSRELTNDRCASLLFILKGTSPQNRCSPVYPGVSWSAGQWDLADTSQCSTPNKLALFKKEVQRCGHPTYLHTLVASRGLSCA